VRLKVYLIEKTPGILSGNGFELLFGPSGGHLDLADYLADRNGSFYLAIEMLGAEEALASKVDSPQSRVFFLSRAKKRRLQGEVIGAGCSDYFDITKSFQKTMQSDGYFLNTSGGRHASVVGGTFVFRRSFGQTLQLAQLTITDSRFSQVFCEN